MAVTIQKNNVHERDFVKKLDVDFTAENDEVIFHGSNLTAMTIQSVGTHGAATIDIRGSNDGVTFAALPTAVSLAAAGIKSVAVADLAYRFYKVIELAAAATLSVYITFTERPR